VDARCVDPRAIAKNDAPGRCRPGAFVNSLFFVHPCPSNHRL